MTPLRIRHRRPTVGGGGSLFDFASDWLTALGQSNAAIADGGNFDAQACGDQSVVNVGDILTAAAAGAPSLLAGQNIFRVTMRGEDCCTIQKQQAVPASTTFWGRVFIANNENANKNDHCIAMNNIHGAGDPIQAVIMQRYGNLGGSVWQLGVPGAGGYPFNRFYSPNLVLGAWYRYEWEMRYLTATTFHLFPRVYNALTDALVADETNYTIEGGGVTLQSWYGSNVLSLGGDGPGGTAAELARNFGMGNEGPGGASASGLSWLYGSVRLGRTGWIGNAM